jgi:hypothetical protein
VRTLTSLNRHFHTAAKKEEELKQSFYPARGNVKDHLLKLGVLAPKDRMRPERRYGTGQDNRPLIRV